MKMMTDLEWILSRLDIILSSPVPAENKVEYIKALVDNCKEEISLD